MNMDNILSETETYSAVEMANENWKEMNVLNALFYS